MKKCPKCGVELPDEAAFCNNCGENLAEKPEDANKEEVKEEPVVAPVSENNQVLENAKEENKNTKIGIIAVIGVAAVLALIIIIALVSSVSGGGKGAVKKYMSAFAKGDAKAMYGMQVPSKNIDTYYDEIYDCDFKEYVEAIQPVYDALWDGLKDEGKVKFSYEIKHCENVNKLDKLKSEAKAMGFKDLDDLKDAWEDAFDDYDMDSEKIKAAWVAEVKWELLVDKDKAAKGSDLVIVYKYGGKLYVLSGMDYNSIKYELDYDDYEDVLDDVSDAYDDFYDDIY